MAKLFIIGEGLLVALVQYLEQCPHKGVSGLIQGIHQVKEYEEPKKEVLEEKKPKIPKKD